MQHKLRTKRHMPGVRITVGIPDCCAESDGVRDCSMESIGPEGFEPPTKGL